MLDSKDLFLKISNKKIVVFGTGSASKQIVGLIPFDVAFYLDNNSSKWGQVFLNSMIYSPEVLKNEDSSNLAILVTSMFYPEIVNQLNKLGFVEGVHIWNGLEVLQDNNTTVIKDIILEYPVESVPRYGYGKPPHQLLYQEIDRNREKYQRTLKRLTQYQSYLNNIPLFQTELNSPEPYWINGFITGLDAISIYGFLALNNPARYFEIGSGNSTKFARQAIKDQGLKTKITSFDPFPRSEIDSICDQVIREPIEKVDLSVFLELEKGDILFIDNSHRSAMNTDVTVVFLDILPYLKKDVLIGFHDIFLPYDYPQNWAKRFYSEQYLLASYLLARGQKIQIELPNCFIMNDMELVQLLNPIWDKSKSGEIMTSGFWIKTS